MGHGQGHSGLRCCPVCRLVQPPAEACRGCGAGAPGRLRRRRGAFYAATDPSGSRGKRLLQLLYFMLAGGWLVAMLFVADWLGIDRSSPFYIFFPFLFAGAFLFVGFFWLVRAVIGSLGSGGPTRPPLEPRLVEPPIPLLEGHGSAHRGTAAASGKKVPAFLGSRDCLAAFLLVGRQHDGSYFLRGLRGEGFFVRQPSGETLLVTGNAWVVWDTKAATASTRKGIEALGHDPNRLLDGPGPGKAAEIVVQEGDAVQVTGPDTREPVAALAAGYREGGGATVLRGTPAQPVLVRLVGPA